MSNQDLEIAFQAHYVEMHEDSEIDDVCFIKKSSVMSDGSIIVSEPEHIDLDNAHEVMELPGGQDNFRLDASGDIGKRFEQIREAISMDENNLGQGVAEALTKRAGLVEKSHGYSDLKPLTNMHFSEDENLELVASFQLDNHSCVLGLDSEGLFHHGLKEAEVTIDITPVTGEGLHVLNEMQNPSKVREMKGQNTKLENTRNQELIKNIGFSR